MIKHPAGHYRFYPPSLLGVDENDHPVLTRWAIQCLECSGAKTEEQEFNPPDSWHSPECSKTQPEEGQ